MRVAVPEKLQRAGDIRCACVDRATGAIWMGAEHGALVYQPATGAWSHVKLKGEAIDACGPGAAGVWLASREYLIRPEPHGTGVRRFRIADATGCGARVTGVAVDRGGTWLVIDGLEGPAPSLLRLPERPPVFQRCHVRLGRVAGHALAVAGDGERAWALGHNWMVELTDDAITRPGQLPEAPSAPSRPVIVPDAKPEDKLVTWVMQLSPACWLRCRPGGLVGRNEQGVFVLPHGGSRPGCPELPGRLDLFATDWLGVDGAMLMASPLGLFVSEQKTLAVIAPGEEIVALLDGDPPIAVTRNALYTLGPAARSMAPRVRLALEAVARELALMRVRDPSTVQRAAAAEALRQVGQPRDLPVFKALLSDQSAEVRRLTCLAIGVVQPPGAKSLLGMMMSDPATGVQAAASAALKWC